MRRIPFVDFPAQYAEEKEAIHRCVEQVFREGQFIGGPAVGALEEAVARFVGTKHAIALNSGTDALIFAMRAGGVNQGDEVITPPNSFVASTAAVVHIGAKPVFVDVLPDQNIDPDRIEAAITPRTKAIMPVHLTGRIADMDPIMKIAARHKLLVVEDAAQAFGSTYNGTQAGALGHVGCFSTHPLKNLNAAGDGGLVTTNDDAIAARIRSLRNHGLVDRNTVQEFAFVSRMDTLQAAFLLERLSRLASVIERRRRNAALYRSLLDPKHVFMPPCRNTEFNTFHTFVVQVDRRDALQKALADAGIGSAIHYPIPIHLQPAAKSLGQARGAFPVVERQAGRILSLPIHQFLTEDDVRHVAQAVNRFYA
jgi:dTDP-4-amino-4,6-dideoxygalactose transaminase